MEQTDFSPALHSPDSRLQLTIMRSYTLFSPLGKLAGRAIYFARVNFFFFIFLHGAKLSQYLLDRFSRSFHQMEDICVNFLDQVQFFRFLKGRCHGNQFCGKNEAKLPTVPALIALSFRYGMRYCYLNVPVRVNSVNDASKSC